MKMLFVLGAVLLCSGSAYAFSYTSPGANGSCPDGYKLGKNGHYCFKGVTPDDTFYVKLEGACPSGYSPGPKGKFCFPNPPENTNYNYDRTQSTSNSTNSGRGPASTSGGRGAAR